MKKILLIEDHDGIRENTAEILELANYQVFTAPNGKVGVEIALREKPHLILCDIMMPVLDGYGVLHLLQKNPATQNTPFIFLTAKSDRNDMRKGMELGADDYITKPFDSTELLNAVESRFRKAALQKEQEVDTIESLEENGGCNGQHCLDELVQNRNVNHYKKKQLIYLEGNRPSRLFFIQKGKVKTFKTNEEGKELVIDLYNENDFLGHVALLEGTSYKETAQALEDTELAVIPKEDFESLMLRNREAALQIIRLLAHHITEKEEHLLGLAYHSLRKKVAEALIKMRRKYGEQAADHFSINISRENLAAIAGTATESLIRTLTDFKNEKIIDIQDGVITLLNEKKLENLLN